MTSQHTPGPWISTGYVANDYEVPYFKIEQDLRDEDGFVKDICPVIAKATYGSEAIMAANARLIAAAPELLAALQALVDAGCKKDNTAFFTRFDQAQDKAIAVIAKAKGGTP